MIYYLCRIYVRFNYQNVLINVNKIVIDVFNGSNKKKQDLYITNTTSRNINFTYNN